MKLLDSLVEKSLTSSKRFTSMIRSFNVLLVQLNQVAKALKEVSKVIHRHELMLNEICRFNNELSKDMQEGSIDTSLPAKRQTKEEKKPN